MPSPASYNRFRSWWKGLWQDRSERVSNELLLVFALFFGAYLLRFIYLWQISDAPFFDLPIEEEQRSDMFGQAFLGGDYLGRRYLTGPPLYPYLVAVLYALIGRNFFFVRLLNALMGGLSCAFVYLIGRRLLSAPAALVAAGLSGLYCFDLFYTGRMVGACLGMLCAALLAHALARAAERPVWRRWLWVGVSLGLLSLERINALIFGPFLCLFLLLSWRRERVMKRLGWCAVVALGVILVVAPVTVRNYVVYDDLVLIANNAGLGFYVGNNPFNLTGTYVLPPFVRPYVNTEKADFTREAERRTGRSLSQSEVSGFWFREGLRFAREQPLTFLKLQARKLLLLWNHYELPEAVDYYFYRRYSSLLSLPLPAFGLLAPLGLLGIATALKRWRGRGAAPDPAPADPPEVARRRGLAMLALFLLAYTASVVPFLVLGRYRLAMVPALAVLAGGAVTWLWRAARELNWRRLATGILLLALAYLFVNQGWVSGQGLVPRSLQWINLGLYYTAKGDYDRAEACYQQCLSEGPPSSQLHFALAALHQARGELEKARDEYLAGLGAGRDFAPERAQLSSILLKLQDADWALEQARRAVVLDPSWAPAEISLAAALLAKGRPEEALEAAQRAAALAEEDPASDPGGRQAAEAHHLQARAYLGLGRADLARAEWERALQLSPGYPPAQTGLEGLNRAGP